MSRPDCRRSTSPRLGLAPVVVTQGVRHQPAAGEGGVDHPVAEQNLKNALEVAGRGYLVETGSITLQGPARELLPNESIRVAYLGI